MIFTNGTMVPRQWYHEILRGNVESQPAVVFDMSLVLIIIGVGAAAVAEVWLGSNMKHSK